MTFTLQDLLEGAGQPQPEEESARQPRHAKPDPEPYDAVDETNTSHDVSSISYGFNQAEETPEEPFTYKEVLPQREPDVENSTSTSQFSETKEVEHRDGEKEESRTKKVFDIPTAPEDTSTTTFPIPTSAPMYDFLTDPDPVPKAVPQFPSVEHDTEIRTVPPKPDMVPAHVETTREPRPEASPGLDLESPMFTEAVSRVIDAEFPLMPNPHLGLASAGLVMFFPMGAYAMSFSELTIRSTYSGDEDTAIRASKSARSVAVTAIVFGILMWALVLFGAYHFQDSIIEFLRSV